MRTFFFLVCVIVFLETSCSKREVTKEELVAFIQDEDNGLRKQNTANEILTEVTYRPTDLWVDLEVGKAQVTNQKLDSLRRNYQDYYYFILNLSKDNKEALHNAPGSMGEYSELVQTLSFRMSEYVTLTTSKQDTIPVGDFILDRTYGLSTSSAVLFVFANEKAKDADWVQFNLNEFGLRTGNQRFRFNTKDIQETPQLLFNTY